MVTPRLVVRPPQERDRARFVELFGDAAFMAFSSGPLANDAADRRFDRMLATCERLRFGKQPMIERTTGTVVGYTGADHIHLDGTPHLEWGWRLVPGVRGKGYASEATSALLATVHHSYAGPLLAIIDPLNRPSKHVALKLGFAIWKRAPVGDEIRDIYRLLIPNPERAT